MMKSSILLICVAFVGAFSCAPKEWEVMQSDVSEGVFLSMAQDGDKLLLVGGQSDQGQVWSTSDEGATLELEPIPNVSLLTWLHVFDDGDVICAGLNGQILWREGENWRADNVGLDAELWGVWAASKNDVWAVGGEVQDDLSVRPLIARYDGDTWTLSFPELENDDVRLFKVTGKSADDVLIVGAKGSALHFSEGTLSEESTGAEDDLVTARLIDNRYLIVGGRNTGTLHERQDDGSWTLIKDTRSGLSGIDSDGEGGLYVAGEFGWLERIDLATNEGNDESVAGVFDVLHSVLKTSSGTMLAAGGTFNQFPGPMQGTLLRLQK